MMLPIPKAATTIYPGNVVRLSIPIPSNPIPKFLWRKWSPGAHVRITVPCIGILQPHPFTIASLPSDGHMQLYIRSREGLSRRLYEKAAASVIGQRQLHLKVHLEGIYGAKHHSFTKFDVVLLIASGIGVTFTIPILQELVQKAKILQQGDCRCRRIGFVWVVKHKGHPSPRILQSTYYSGVKLVFQGIINLHGKRIRSSRNATLHHPRRTSDPNFSRSSKGC